MNPVVHFEMPYENFERLQKFYSSAFGWQLQNLGAAMGDYVTAATAPTDENRMVTTPGTINGGFFAKQAAPDLVPSVVIHVPDLQAAIERVREAGGTTLGETMLIPGVGHIISFLDSEGNRASMIQPMSM